MMFQCWELEKGKKKKQACVCGDAQWRKVQPRIGKNKAFVFWVREGEGCWRGGGVVAPPLSKRARSPSTPLSFLQKKRYK